MARWVWSRVLGVFVAVLALMAGLMLAIAGPSRAAASACDAVSGNLVDDCGFEGGAAPSW